MEPRIKKSMAFKNILCLMTLIGMHKGACGMKASPDTRSILKRAISIISSQQFPKINISGPCLMQVLSPKFQSNWMKYLDATGKPESGLFQGNMFWPGSYDQCSSLNDAHYCLSSLKLSPVPYFTETLGVCAPDKCNANDVFSIFTYATKVLNISNIVYIPRGSDPSKSPSISCSNGIKSVSGSIGMLVFCGIVLALCLLGTLVDVLFHLREEIAPKNAFMQFKNVDSQQTQEEVVPYGNNHVLTIPVSKAQVIETSNKKTSKVVDVLLCFSLIKNIETLVDTKVPPGAVTCLNGIRVISMCWVILCHAQIFCAQPFVIDNIAQSLKKLQTFTFLPIDNGYFSVDSFFFLSGLLVSYLAMRRFEKRGNLPLLHFYLHRFLRLTPAYIFVILFYIYIFPLLGKGPAWDSVLLPSIQTCKDYWWTNLLYVNNFYPIDASKMCIGWTWYLANDMQFYVISPVILYLMHRFKFPGAFISIGGILVGGFIATGALVGYYGVNAFMSAEINDPHNAVQQKASFNYIYIKPYCRISPYLVGLLTGYVLHKETKIEGNRRWVIALIGWCLAIAAGMMLTYGAWPYFRPDNVTPSEAVSVAYGTFSRFVWGLALAWVAYACHFGIGGYINRFLSWRAFIPLSRLTYGVYLVHIIVLNTFYYGREKTFHYSDTEVSIFFIAAVVLSYGSAFILAVCLEIPISNLEKMILKF